MFCGLSLLKYENGLILFLLNALNFSMKREE